MVDRTSRSLGLFTLPLVAALAGACGGSSGGGAKSAANANDAKPVPDISIGDAALAQGGLDSLGGGSNRANQAASAAQTLRFDRLDKDSPVKMDGSIREWPARTTARKVVSGDASKTSFSVALQYDDAHVYVGGEVGDAAFIRSSRFAETEDHAVLTIAFPVGAGGALAAYDVSLFAGEPGETSGVVRFASGARRGQGVPGAKIIEAPATGGYTFEASIPWSAFPEGRATRVGLRGAVRYVDSDGPNSVHAVVSSGDGDAAHAATLPALLTEPEQAVIEGLLIPKGLLGASPRFDLVADVAGDGMKERITVYDQFLAICGPHYRSGNQFFYRDVGGEVASLDAREVTGRAKEDLVLQRKIELGGAIRQWFEVWSILGKGDEPQTTFGHEVSVSSGSNRVTNTVHVSGRDIEVSIEGANGWDASSYREPTASDIEPVLLPWGGTKSQIFRFDGTKFAKVKEVTQTPAPGAPGAPTPPDTFKSTLAEARAQEPATPDVAKGKDLSKDVFALYRQDHSVAASVKPRVDLQVNVANDARPERVVLIGKDIVVLGPGFKNGTGYAMLTLAQFADEDDVKDLSVRDLTGDGAADLVVRGVRHVSAAGSHEPVDSESIFIYELDTEAITRVFAIETGRSQHSKRVQGLVQFIPSDDHKSFEIDVRPGLARGWNKKSYPWAQEQPGGQMEPLLLPWGGVDEIRYAWDGAKFAQKQ